LEPYFVINPSFEAQMRVADVMQTPVRAVQSDATVAEVVQRLADTHVSGVPVVDNGGRLVGVVSTTDVLEAEATADGQHERQVLFENTTAEDIMTRRPLTISPQADLREAAQEMLYAEVHRLFVEEDGKLVGVISQTDIVRAFALGGAAAGA
jgi:CBS domain-containing protein